MDAIGEMSKTKTGALIIFEKDTGLDDIIVTGTKLDAIISCELILNIFTPNTPLHDGAVVIRMSENKLSGLVFTPLNGEQEHQSDFGNKT